MFSRGSLKASMPATAMLLCMGLFSIFWLEARAASALAAVFPVDDRSMACQAVAREPRARLRPMGSGAEVWKRGGEAWAQEAVETGLTRARHQPAIGATKSTRLVGLRRSLASCLPPRQRSTSSVAWMEQSAI